MKNVKLIRINTKDLIIGGFLPYLDIINNKCLKFSTKAKSGKIFHHYNIFVDTVYNIFFMLYVQYTYVGTCYYELNCS